MPHGAGVVLIVAGVANLVSIPLWPLGVIGFIGQFFFAAGLARVGYALVSRYAEEAVQPSPPISEVRSTNVGG